MASVVVSGIVTALHALFPAIPLSPVDASGGLGAMFDTAQATFGIVESGSNSNGSYIKLADGTMICEGVSANVQATNSDGSLYYNSVSVTFAAAFVGSNPIIKTGIYGPTSYGWVGNSNAISLTGATIMVVCARNTPIWNVLYSAKGSWK